MPATSPCSKSAFKSSYSALKMTSGCDPSTPRSDFSLSVEHEKVKQPILPGILQKLGF